MLDDFPAALAGRCGCVLRLPVEGVSNVKGKVKRFRGAAGRRKGWKKAFVGLKAGQEINFVEGGNA